MSWLFCCLLVLWRLLLGRWFGWFGLLCCLLFRCCLFCCLLVYGFVACVFGFVCFGWFYLFVVVLVLIAGFCDPFWFGILLFGWFPYLGWFACLCFICGLLCFICLFDCIFLFCFDWLETLFVGVCLVDLIAVRLLDFVLVVVCYNCWVLLGLDSDFSCWFWFEVLVVCIWLVGVLFGGLLVCFD